MTEAHELGMCIITGAFLILFGFLMGAIMWSSDSKISAVVMLIMFVGLGAMIIIPRAEDLYAIENAEETVNSAALFAQYVPKEEATAWIPQP